MIHQLLQDVIAGWRRMAEWSDKQAGRMESDYGRGLWQGQADGYRAAVRELQLVLLADNELGRLEDTADRDPTDLANVIPGPWDPERDRIGNIIRRILPTDAPA